MALYDEGVIADSPPETESSPAVDPSSAGTENTDQNGQPLPGRQGNWLPQDRAEQMAQRRAEAAVAQAEARFAQQMAAERERYQQFFTQQSQADRQLMLQSLQQRAQTPSRTPEEEAQRQQAVAALHDLFPGLRHMPALAQSQLNTQEQLRQQAQELAQLRQSYAQSFVHGEQGRLQQMATSSGLTFQNPQQFAAFENYVAGVIRSDPRAHAAFAQGDPNVLPWALAIAREQIAAPQQAARAALNQTKTMTSKLPPSSRGGGVPGSAPKLPNPTDPDFEKKLFAGARGFLTERMGAA